MTSIRSATSEPDATATAAEPDVAPAAPPSGTAAPARAAPAGRTAGVVGWVGDRLHRGYTAVQREALLVMVLLGSFFGRWLLADKNSYWLDELLSVHVYGHWHDSAMEAVQYLATNSIHPPLYQFILYHWIDWFDETERATRSLSNLYITLATLALYLLVRDAFSRRVALTSAVAFALMYTSMYYGMETRSYAQTIFLVTLSSLALLRLMRVGSDRGWRSALLSPMAALFTVANVAVLLTHYYNVFFWAAQAIIAVVFVLRELPVRRWLAGLGMVGAMYALQGAIFALLWGQVLVSDIRRRGGAFAVEGGVQSPVELLRTVVKPNLAAPRLVALIGIAIGAILLIRAVAALARKGGLTATRQQAWTVFYLAGWLLLPLLVVYTVFEITGIARYSIRYWLFIVPPLAPLLVLTVREAVHLVAGGLSGTLRHVPARTLPRGQARESDPADRRRNPRVHPAWLAVAAGGVIAALILPGTLAAATETKHDWRGIVQQVVNLVQADPEHSYLIFETSHRRQPMANYYFSQFSNEVRVYDTLQRYEERTGEYRILTVDEPVIAQHDYLVVVFTHSRVSHFPDALTQLEERYEVRHRQLNRAGRGFIVFEVHPDRSNEEQS